MVGPGLWGSSAAYLRRCRRRALVSGRPWRACGDGGCFWISPPLTLRPAAYLLRRPSTESPARAVLRREPRWRCCRCCCSSGRVAQQQQQQQQQQRATLRAAFQRAVLSAGECHVGHCRWLRCAVLLSSLRLLQAGCTTRGGVHQSESGRCRAVQITLTQFGFSKLCARLCVYASVCKEE